MDFRPAEASVKKQPGIRGVLKQQTMHRITSVARQLFAEQGYDNTTVRQIAESAGLSSGALFNHVRAKRDVIHLIFSEDIEAVTDAALEAPRSYQRFKEKMLSVTERYFKLFASDPVLYRILLSELLTASDGNHPDGNQTFRSRFVVGIESVVREAQLNGDIRPDQSSDIIAVSIFFTFSESLRWWLTTSVRPDWRRGHREYERLLTLQLEGLSLSIGKEERSIALTAGSVPNRQAKKGAVPCSVKAQKIHSTLAILRDRAHV